jgi:hypothetical protein
MGLFPPDHSLSVSVHRAPLSCQNTEGEVSVNESVREAF